MKKKGLIIKDILDCYYIYKITLKTHKQNRNYWKNKLSNYMIQNILGHEETFENRVIERKNKLQVYQRKLDRFYCLQRK
jgi:uncharacterized protein (DUF1015 family)